MIAAVNAWNAAGAGGAAPWLASDVVLEDPPGWPRARCRRGRDAVVERIDEVTAELRGRWAEVLRMSAAGDEILVQLRLRASGSREGVPVATFFALVTVRHGEMARLRMFVDESEVARALTAGG